MVDIELPNLEGFYPLLLIQVASGMSRISQPSIYFIQSHFLSVHRLIIPSLEGRLTDHLLDTIYR